MRVDLFDFPLPEDLIAAEPVIPREKARMLEVSGDGSMVHSHIEDLLDRFSPGDVFIFNNTKVLPARLFGMRGEAKVEATLLKQKGEGLWNALVKNARRLKPGQCVTFSPAFPESEVRGSLRAVVMGKNEDGTVLLKFSGYEGSFFDALSAHGVMPLPPYIHRSSMKTDFTTYQSVFARHEGAVAAPTASLHFTERFLNKMKERGFLTAEVTLHVGGGTFLPVKVDETDDHKMHAEWGEISQGTADFLNDAQKRGKKLIAVGTTVLRILESSAKGGAVHPFSGETDIFITPGYRFQSVPYLLTNFHLPKSTLFMLVSAFAGMDKMKEAYQEAIENKYRFFSYGDACLLRRK